MEQQSVIVKNTYLVIMPDSIVETRLHYFDYRPTGYLIRFVLLKRLYCNNFLVLNELLLSSVAKLQYNTIKTLRKLEIEANR